MALGGLVVLGPLLMVIALAVKFTSPGPVFYWQDRLGLNGRTFRLVKFRSMRLEQCDADGLRQVTSDDDRMTPIGRFIRANSIDELVALAKAEGLLTPQAPTELGGMGFDHATQAAVFEAAGLSAESIAQFRSMLAAEHG